MQWIRFLPNAGLFLLLQRYDVHMHLMQVTDDFSHFGPLTLSPILKGNKKAEECRFSRPIIHCAQSSSLTGGENSNSI